MTRIRRTAWAALVVAAALVPAGAARAGWLFGCNGDCQKPSYSPLRYWTPSLARASDCVHGPKLSVYPTDTHPEIPASHVILKYPCPPVDAAATLIPVPTPAAAPAR